MKHAPVIPTLPRAGHRWITPARLRRQTATLAVVMWLAYAINLATPGLRDRFGHLKGADFLHWYTLGTLALQHRGADLYDAAAQAEVSLLRVPESAGVFFLPIYGPQVSLLAAPVALLEYRRAVVVWLSITALIYFTCCYWIWRRCPNLAHHRGLVFLLALAFPGFFNLVANGQNSALALLAFTSGYLALRARRNILAGLCFSLLAYKPQLGLVVAAVLLFSGAWKVTTGAALGVAAQFAAATLYYGPEVLADYANALLHIGSASAILEPKPWLMHCLRAFFNILLPWHGLAVGLYAFTALAATVVAVLCWRTRSPLELRYSVLLLTTVLVAPHLTVYDLVILAPALLFVVNWLLSCDFNSYRHVQWLLYLAYVLPLLGPAARFTHLQVSVIAFTGLAVVFAKVVLGHAARVGAPTLTPQEDSQIAAVS